MDAQEILQKIKVGEILKKDLYYFLEPLGFKGECVDINAAPFYLDRYSLIEVKISDKKRGNLAKYAGKTVQIIPTTVSRAGARINFYIREKQ